MRHDKDSEFGGKTTGSAVYAYAFTPAWRGTASVGTAFRAPTLYQRFSVYGVPTLVPESSRNVEPGSRWGAGREQRRTGGLPQQGGQPDHLCRCGHLRIAFRLLFQHGAPNIPVPRCRLRMP